MSESKPDNGSPKPRKLTQTQKNNYVMQSAGARQACFELLRRVKDPAARSEIIKQGKLAEGAIIEYGGMFFGESFEVEARRIIMEAANA